MQTATLRAIAKWIIVAAAFMLPVFAQATSSRIINRLHPVYPANFSSETGKINQESSAPIPGEFDLEQNYPNPFNAVTEIKFVLAKDSRVTLSVYNIVGQRVENLISATMPAGSHEVRFDAQSMPSGVYFYKLTVGGKSQVRKMDLLR